MSSYLRISSKQLPVTQDNADLKVKNSSIMQNFYCEYGNCLSVFLCLIYRSFCQYFSGISIQFILLIKIKCC